MSLTETMPARTVAQAPAPPARPEPVAPEPPRPNREVYRDELLGLMRADPRVVCLDSDTGLFNPVDWAELAPRYVNVGIAEQNLMGVAAGLAATGRRPFVNTMATFATTRALESVKLDVARTALPVRIAATHSGLAAGHLGATHHSLEDLAVMRLLPNMTILVPADAEQTRTMVRAADALPGPVYLRLGRGATPALPPGVEPAVPGRAQTLRRGTDVTLVATGPYPVLRALEAADRLAAEGVSARVLNMHTIKPLDEEALLAAARTTAGLVTVEEHWVRGGLGSAVAEVVSGARPCAPVLRVGVADAFAVGSGGHEHLLARNGITTEAILDRAHRLLAGE
ncbi:transketolase C-terminal domain-containing protein [Streptomyces sp. NPDC006552]|uniref:transketolase family protein n=1 Tax=Streptomyces sp. NPDC006552 TaxID=3157179 RepID=UPI00339F01B9